MLLLLRGGGNEKKEVRDDEGEDDKEEGTWGRRRSREMSHFCYSAREHAMQLDAVMLLARGD